MNTNEPNSSPAPLSWKNSILLGLAVALLALVVRLPSLGESLWVDELHTAWVVSDGIQDVPYRAAMGNQASLYFLVVWVWTQLAGLHEWSLRLPSLLGGVLCVGLITGIAHRWTRDVWIAIACGVIAAIDIDWIFFATEARVYGFVQVVAVLQILIAWQLLQHDRRSDWIWLVVVTVGSFYLHYSTLLFSLCLAAMLLLLADSPSKRKHLMMAATGVAFGVLIATPHLTTIFERRQNWAQFITATSRNEWTRWGTALAALGPVVLLAMLYARQWSAEAKRALLVGGVVFVPIAIAWFTTATGLAALFFGRYLISSETLIPLLLASLASLAPLGWGRIGAMIVSVVIAFGLRTPQALGPMRGEDWRTITQAAATELESRSLPTDVLIASGLIEADILRMPTKRLPPYMERWEAYSQLPIGSIYALPEHAGEHFGLTYTHAGEATPRYRSRSEPSRAVLLIVRGTKETADQVVQNFLGSLPDRKYEVTTPETQTARVQWRVLLPIESSASPEN
ncbi:glycosyltransferase family 39 protein [Bremerella sp.]|uniref:glycosyltransferase family 39 protein n=1 Tax=Bremerella sp. TaxID=2795602 RepID=UPI00391D3FFE